MILDRFWQLLAKKLSGEATEEEVRELEEIIKTNPDLSFAGQNVADIWNLQPKENKANTEKAFVNIMAKLELEDNSFEEKEPWETDVEKPARGVYKKWLAGVSLAIAVGLTVSYFMWFRSNDSFQANAKQQVQEIYTRPGTRTKVVLPDGSTVWLNAGSKLSYGQPFGDKERSVTLSGEAYFDVVKNKTPFIIHTNGASIKVLGTAFNVRSYPLEKKVETSLVHGRVEVTLDNNPENKYVLKPSQKLVLTTEEVKAKKKKDRQQNPIVVLSTIHYLDNNTIAETSWVDNKLVFEDETFEEIARKMERWYGVTIQFKAAKLKQERLTGVFEKETVAQALSALQETTPFHFAMKNNEIIITP